jgi:NAD(P)H dehydrogenase (quinone)
LTKMGAAPKDEAIPVLTPDDLTKYDGFIFCIPTRYGRAVGQFSSLFDQTGGLWAKQALSRKFAAIITSTGTQHGGQEVTALTTLPFLTHHGIIYVPYGYKNPALMQMNTVEGGSPWGASTLAAADGSRQPSQLELDTAKDHGKDFAEIVGIYVKGNTA